MRSLLKASQDAGHVEIGSLLATVEFNDGVEFGHENGAQPLNSELLGQLQAKELVTWKSLDIGTGIETVSLCSTNQPNASR